MSDIIPFAKPSIGEEEIKEVTDTLKSGWLSLGPKTKAFEEAFARYVGAKYAVGVNSCTSALFLSLKALLVGKGDEVITTPLTFAATVNVILHVGAKPIFADIDPFTCTILPAAIENKITDKTVAIIPVHYAGHPCDMNQIIRIANKFHVSIIEDAAHAVGAEYCGVKVGSISDVTCFSFYSTKNLCCGENGMVTTNNKQIADKIRLLRLHGMSAGAWNRYTKFGSWDYEVTDCGYKMNMDDIHASLGIHQLRKLDKFNEIRREYARMYDEAFRDLVVIDILEEMNGCKSARHLYPIFLLDYNRDKFIAKMTEKKIMCSVHFKCIHLQPYYRKRFKYHIGDFPRAERRARTEVSLPLYPAMTQEEVERIIRVVKDIVK